MPYLFLGVILLAALVLMAQWMARADPSRIASALKWTAGAAAVAIALFLAATGRLAGAVATLTALAPLLMRWRALWNRVKTAAGPTPGASSTVNTAMLHMTLDHDSGGLEGEIVAGEYKGKRLSALDLASLREVLRECRVADVQGAALLEAYLDKRFGPDWRKSDEAQTGARGFSAGAMSRDEAYEILGLAPGAGTEEIKSAYHRLMLKLHPDQGGSTFLAAKINQARDVLLGG
jgi:hypothetical protein